MKVFFRAGLLAAMVLGAFTVVSAQYFEPAVFVNLDEVEGLDPDGSIPDGGGDLTFPVRFVNIDEARTAISNGYHFNGDGVTWTGIEAQLNQNYCWDWSGFQCWFAGIPPFFDQGMFINYFDNGVGIAGLTGGSGTGLPADFNDVAYYITLSQVNAESGGTLTLDTTWWAPANYWLWSGVAENVYWGGPYVLPGGCMPCAPYTDCWPQPTILKELGDRILEIRIYFEDPDEVILESILVQGKIPPYEGYPYVDGNVIVTGVFIPRFLGASGFRPIPPEGIQDQYTVEYDKTDGTHTVLVGDYVLAIYQGDLTLDGQVNIDDVQFMSDYFWGGGRMCEFEEFMDVDANGRVDIRDMSALIEIVGI